MGCPRGVPSLQRSGYVFGRWEWDWRYSTEDMPRMSLCSVSIFRRRAGFELLTLKFQRRCRKVQGNQFLFGEKRPLKGKISKFRYERIHRHMDGIFLVSFAEIGKAEVTNVVFITKKVGIVPFLCGFWSDLAKKIYSITPCPFPFPLPSFVQIRPVFEEVYPKMSSRLNTVWPWRFSPTLIARGHLVKRTERSQSQQTVFRLAMSAVHVRIAMQVNWTH